MLNEADQPIRTYSRRSLHGQVAAEIGSRIMGGRLAPGSVLPNEAALGVELGVSRTVLREAIKMLAAKGLVESRPKIGTRVRAREQWNTLDPDVLAWRLAAGDVLRYADDLIEVRRIIEPAGAALAATRASERDLTLIEQAYRDMEAAGADVDASVEPDLRFHLAILAAARNEFLHPLGALIETALASSFKLSGSNPGAQYRSLPRHRAVLDAIRAGAPERARLAMDDLLAYTTGEIHDALGRGGAARPRKETP